MKDYILSTQEIELLKQRQILIMKKFIEFCKRNNLRYYLWAGTLLGAVRHKGFIPWDDDIDLCMPRKDYEKLLKLDGNAIGNDLFIQSIYTDHEYCLPFVKIRDNHSIFKEISSSKLNINHGVFIDIFPVNYIHKNRIIRFFQNLKIYQLNIIINKELITEQNDGKFKKKIKNILSLPYSKKDLYFVKLTREQYISKFSNNKTEYVSCGLFSFKTNLKSCYFENETILSFEGLDVKSPSMYHELLTDFYGDYLTLPPVEKRKTQHPIIEFKINE